MAISPQCSPGIQPCLQVALNEQNLIIQESSHLKWHLSLTGIQYFTAKLAANTSCAVGRRQGLVVANFLHSSLRFVTLIFFFSNYAKDVSRGSEIWGAIPAKCGKIELRTPEEESKNSTVQWNKLTGRFKFRRKEITALRSSVKLFKYPVIKVQHVLWRGARKQWGIHVAKPELSAGLCRFQSCSWKCLLKTGQASVTRTSGISKATTALMSQHNLQCQPGRNNPRKVLNPLKKRLKILILIN